ncbi:FadR/GntR family transcriptional regulator [Methylobacterium sp. J-070]|uniref:FadR/GntR family transcriptional regulator n=1 Tax=Methylobacterium sp. J-070 TaxID=2836650 RepID=UPI001FB94486|nr:FCD domain-containing protein [Methylobacterium sp. J-070]MCJ2048934.1 FCD domain-containing protein [Methylobacterium sp. J-070]
MTDEVVLPKESATGLVLRVLRQGLASGRFRPGSKLPTERVLAVDLSVPRTAVREALAVLEAQNMIIRQVGSGTFVLDEATVAHSHSQTMSDPSWCSSPNAIMEARLVVEPRLAHLVVSNATAADFARLGRILAEGETADTTAAFDAADDAFHQAVADSTHNALVIEIYSAIAAARRRMPWGGLRRRFLTAERRVASRREHRAIVEALAARDAEEAERAILAHLHEIKLALMTGDGRRAIEGLESG